LLTPGYARQFKKDLRKIRRSTEDVAAVRAAIFAIVLEQPLEPRYRDHKLLGKFADRRECHIRPDLLLIYKKTGDIVVFERLGSHSQLFK